MEAATGLNGRALVFIGFMGAGKTTAARAAARALGARAVDSDHEIEQRIGGRIDDFFAAHGEAAFRALEEQVVCELLDAPPGPVLSLGGGAAGSERVREALARHTVVLLDVDTATAWHRAGGRRPLARDRAAFEALHAARRPLYDRIADVVLTDSSRDAVRRAVPAIAALPEGTRMLWARSASGEYPVYVGRGVLGADPAGGRAFLVTDDTVGALYGDAVGEVAGRIEIPPGEAAKTWDQAGARAAGARGGRDGAATTTSSRSAAAWSATSPASARRRTSAACRSSSSRRRSSHRSTRPTAARPASTCRRARTTRAPTTSRRPSWPTRPCSRRCRRRSSPRAGPR